jgi:EH domain-containing protein 1
MGSVFRTVMKKYNLAPGDFPDLADFLSKIADLDFTKFHSLRLKVL